jgi:hypothetical protein
MKSFIASSAAVGLALLAGQARAQSDNPVIQVFFIQDTTIHLASPAQVPLAGSIITAVGKVATLRTTYH